MLGARSPAGLHLVMPARADSVGLAREAARAGISVPGPVLEDVTVVVSELVTNAVRHAGLSGEDTVRLDLIPLEDYVRVEVSDRGPGFDPVAVEAREPTASGGFGLRIVASLSRAWGVLPGLGAVWADIPR